MADGSIRIGVELKDDGLKKGLENLKKVVKSLENEADDINFDEAAQSAEELADGVEEATEEVKKTGKEYDDTKEKAKGVGDETEKNTKKQKENTEEVKKTKKTFEDVKKAAGEFREQLEKAKEATSNIKGKAEESFGDIANGAKAAGAAAVAAASYAVKFNSDYKTASNSFQAQTGKSKAEMEQFEEVLKDIYKGNYGEDIEDVGNAMAIVAQSARDVSPDNIKKLTTNAIVLRDTFGFEVNESMRTANMLIDQFGMSGEEAFNLIAQGAQNGLDKNGDLLDSINEYSVHYKQLGFGAEEMFNSFVNGAETGTFSVDKLGDTIKEFGIRAKDNSTATNQAFKDLKLNSKALTQQFAKGGAEGRKAFNTVIKALFETEDAVKRNEIGVALFGTMWEDLGEDGVKALSDITGEADRTKQTIQDINNVRYDDLASALAEVKRTFEIDVLQPLGEELTPVVGEFADELKAKAPEVKEAIGGMAEGFVGFAEWVLDNHENIATAIKAMFAVVGAAKTIGFIASTINDFKTLAATATMAGGVVKTALAALSGPVGWTALAIGGVGAAIYGAYQYAEKADEAFYNMGDSVAEAGQKYDEAKRKAELTDDYAKRWEELNKAISNGSLSGADLTKAETERKSIEEWFIQNYGDYITAEEEKNGIRKESIDTIKEHVKLLSERERVELELKALEMKKEIPDRAREIAQMKTVNDTLEAQNVQFRTNELEVEKAMTAWNNLTDEQQMSGKYQDLENKTIAECNKILDENCNSLVQVRAAIAEKRKEVEKNDATMQENNEKITEGTDSLQAYADNCRKLIEADLGGSLEETASKYDLVKSAMDKLNSGTALTEDEINTLKEKFPELAEQDVNIETLQKVFDTLHQKIDTAKRTAYDFGVELNGLPKNIDINIKLNVPDIPQFASGTKNAPRGAAVVNDGNGPELIRSKDGSFRMVQSNGPALTVLDKGDTVYTAEETKAMMKSRSRSIPHFAGGKPGARDWGTVTINTYIDKVPEAFEKALDTLKLRKDLDVVSEKEYYEELERLRDEYFERYSDKWWEFEKEIVNYQKSIVKEHETLYATHTANGMEIAYKKGYEYTEAMSEAMKETELLRELDIISENEYYERMGRYRDEYFEKGTEGWWNYTLQIREYHNRLAEEQQAIEEQITQLIKDANEERIALGTDYMRNKSAVLTQLIADVNDEKANLESAKQEAIQDKYNEFGLFDAVDNELVKGDDLLKNLRQQNQRRETYETLLQKIRERSGSDAFVDELESMGIDEYANVAAISRMSDAKLKSYLYEWEKKHTKAEENAQPEIERLEAESAEREKQLRADAEREMDALKKTYMQSVADLEETLAENLQSFVPQMKELGEDVAQGIADGIESKGQNISRALIEVVKNALQDTKDVMDINSPSEVTKKEVGYNMGAGIDEGLLESIKDIDIDAIYSRLSRAFEISPPKSVFDFNPTINNTVTLAGGGMGEAVFEIDGDRLGRIMYPYIEKEKRRKGVKLIE